MIIGIGNDIANIKRIEQSIENFDKRFLNRIFADIEVAECERRNKVSPRERACAYAKRFAAKEACSKALGTGLRKGVFWRDMVISHQSSGKPELKLYGGAARRLKEIVPEGKEGMIAVTISDDYPFAIANVIIYAV
ncbi:MAG: holo-ACP synthase [Alphaproteobacteria bacterium]